MSREQIIEEMEALARGEEPAFETKALGDLLLTIPSLDELRVKAWMDEEGNIKIGGSLLPLFIAGEKAFEARNYEFALACYKRAVEKEDSYQAAAFRRLGEFYHHGYGRVVMRNPALASRYYLDALEKGDPLVENNLRLLNEESADKYSSSIMTMMNLYLRTYFTRVRNIVTLIFEGVDTDSRRIVFDILNSATTVVYSQNENAIHIRGFVGGVSETFSTVINALAESELVTDAEKEKMESECKHIQYGGFILDSDVATAPSRGVEGNASRLFTIFDLPATSKDMALLEALGKVIKTVYTDELKQRGILEQLKVYRGRKLRRDERQKLKQIKKTLEEDLESSGSEHEYANVTGCKVGSSASGATAAHAVAERGDVEAINISKRPSADASYARAGGSVRALAVDTDTSTDTIKSTTELKRNMEKIQASSSQKASVEHAYAGRDIRSSTINHQYVLSSDEKEPTSNDQNKIFEEKKEERLEDGTYRYSHVVKRAIVSKINANEIKITAGSVQMGATDFGKSEEIDIESSGPVVFSAVTPRDNYTSVPGMANHPSLFGQGISSHSIHRAASQGKAEVELSGSDEDKDLAL